MCSTPNQCCATATWVFTAPSSPYSAGIVVQLVVQPFKRLSRHVELSKEKLGWEAFAGLVTAAVFKTVEAYESGLGGFDSHPLPPNYLPNQSLSLAERILASRLHRKLAGYTEKKRLAGSAMWRLARDH